MTAYVISEVEVLDVASMERYRDLAQAPIESDGGRYIVGAATPEAAERDWSR